MADAPPAGALQILAERLAEAGRLGEAEDAYRAALLADPLFAPAALGLAHLLMRQGRADDAAEATKALACQPTAPLPVIDLHVRALMGAGRLEEALPMSRRAAAAGAPHAELGSAQIAANLGRFAEAEAGFRAVLARYPGDERARRGLARALFAGPEGAEGALTAIDEGLDLRWSPALAGRAEDAVAHAEAALRLAPGESALTGLLAEACLGAGDAARALQLLDPLRRQAPFDQKLIALQATAQRLNGDERAHRLYDYERFVRAYTLEPPHGWPTLQAFLVDLGARLNAIHDGQGQTLDQSVRGGTQTNINLVGSPDPLIQALFLALEAPITDYISRLPGGGDPLADPLAARNRGGFALGGAWSVRLAPGVGRHVNHIHSEGWLSSAFYVDLPDVMNGEGEEGWIQFGEPGLPTRPPLPAPYKLKPEPGRLVLFPSYMWHGTRPFGGTQTRLTFAFDVVPADRR